MPYSDAYDPDEGIAIIGMAGRFPGARNIAQLWRNLLDARETISHFRADELDPALPEDVAERASPGYVRARGILDDVEMFDAGFFGINPKEAEVLDPQQRVFLETTWEALEDAGYDPQTFGGAVGVFAGSSNNSYSLQNLLHRRDVTGIVGWITTMMGNEKDYLTTRVAYKLDLKGPALNIQTACSTSLVAVCSAVHSLLGYQCDMALAGGVSVTLPQRRGYLWQEGAITSPDGHCRAFDRDAQGTVFSNGVGVVVLRRLRDARADGDTIYAIIKGAALNNDGSSKVSFTAPSVDGHAQLIAMAQALGGIDPETISYVEAHGTGTALGDPVEIAGLTQAFRTGGARGKGFCAIGSLKTNIGHLDAAAGVAGLVKTALALHHKVLPPSLHFNSPNPNLGIEESPFYVNARLQPWTAGATPRRAGVSSFGVGGTNSHVVLEEAPAAEPGGEGRNRQLLVLSARSPEGLDRAAARLTEHLAAAETVDLADAAYTLQTGRRAFSHRRALVCRDRTDAVQLLAQPDPKRVLNGNAERQLAGVAFLFPGQGAQYVNMGRTLYESEERFRREVDECCEVLRPQLDVDLRAILYPPQGGTDAAQQSITQTAVTQPALFVIEHALAQLWMSWGVQPFAMIGHSLGEYVAACLAGVFTRDDALRLLARRARMMQDLPPGSMLAVRAPLDAITADLGPQTSVAALNAPSLTVISGDHTAIADLEARLTARGVTCRRLPTSHAFHSPMMEPIVASFAEVVRAVPRAAPTRRWVSGLTGRLITDAEAIDPAYWARQMRQPVRFMDGVGLLMDPNLVLLEIGPGQALTSLARQHPERKAEQLVLTSLHPGQEFGADLDYLLAAAGRLWTGGIGIDWAAFHAPAKRRRISLPTYPFERTRCWVSPGAVADPGAPAINAEADMPADNTQASDRGRQQQLEDKLRALFSDLSGIDASRLDPSATFLEHGFDSLFLTQASTVIQKTFGAKITLRDLLGDLANLRAVAERLDQLLPAEALAAPRPAPAPSQVPAGRAAAAVPSGSTSSPGTLEQVLMQQLDLMRNQLEMIRGGVGVVAAAPPAAPTPTGPAARPEASKPRAPELGTPAAAHGPYRPIAKGPAGALSSAQREHLDAFIARYVGRTAESKRLTQASRPYLADPRSVSGFRQLWKELVYPIVVDRSSGSKLWDVDGNEYIDLVCGFGPILLGHNPAIVRDAIKSQLEQGIETGPQTPLAGKVARLVCEMTGMERVAFCNTGSEAVMAAIRVARTVTGRDLIVLFSGAYHGLFDEVLVRAANGTGTSRAMPLAPGIPAAMADNVLVLEYGSPAALDVVKARGHELAAVLVEPVQSRRPELQPRDFVKKLRALTEASGTALILDEVVTGFRTHSGGIQALWDVRADLATYGKVVGGGLPIGLVAGCAKYMDALDGGMWRYGDDSVPEVGVTFFAGTFVRHPLALAVAHAVLDHLKGEGPELQRRLNLRTTLLVETLEREAAILAAPIRITHFSSWFCLNVPPELPFASLLYAGLRARGIHLWEGRAGFLTTAHTDADLERVVHAFRESIIELQTADFLPGGRGGRAKSRRPCPARARAVTGRGGTPGSSPIRIVRANICRSATGHGPVTEAMRGDAPLIPVDFDPFADETTPAVLPLTEPQREVWTAVQMGDEASCAYNQCYALTLRGSLSVDSMQSALRQVMERHDALRVRFDVNGEHQKISASSQIALAVTDLSHLAPESRAAEIARVLQAETTQSFDLAAGPLLRARLIREAADLHRLIVTVHHIVCDGWSSAVLLGDLSCIYAADRHGLRAQLPLAAPYVDYVVREAALAETAPARADEDYWAQQYADSVPVLDLPLDRPRPGSKTYNGACQTLRLDESLYRSLKAAGAQHGCTLFVTLLAGWEALISHLSSQQDFVVGVPMAGQALLENGHLVGHCVNLIPLRCRLEPAAPFVDHLKRVRHAFLEAQSHQQLTFGSLVRRLNVPRDPGRTPLVSTTFNIDKIGAPFDFGDLVIESVEGAAKRFVDFEIVMNVVDTGRDLTLECEYNTDLFTSATIGRWLGHYRMVLEAIASDSGQRTGDLPLLTDAGRRQLLDEWNDTDTGDAGAVVFDGQIEFWRRQLGGTLPALELPLDKPRPVYQSFRRANVFSRIPAAIAQDLRSLAAREGCTPFMVLLTAFQVLLHRYSGADDIVIGTPIGTRPARELEPVIGNFLNMVALRGDLSGDPTFAQVLRAGRETVLNAFSNGDVPYEAMMQHLNVVRDPGRNPVFQVGLQLLSNPLPRLGDLEVASSEFDLNFAQFDLTLHLYEEAEEYRTRFDYCTDLFDGATIERISQSFSQLLEAITREPDQRIAVLPILADAERRRLLETWSTTAPAYPADRCLHEIIEEQVARTPDQPAVAFEDQTLTYRELDRRANRVAHRLRELGAGPDARVGLLVERSLDLVVGIVGTLKAGAAYVPMDAAFPRERIAFMLADAGVQVVLTQGDLLGSLPVGAVQAVRLDTFDWAEARDETAPRVPVGPDNLAYVIYTSGSTGRPKGVGIEHRNIVNYTRGISARLQLAPGMQHATVSTIAADLGNTVIFPALATGGCLHVVSQERAESPARLAEYFERERIDVLKIVPSHLAALQAGPPSDPGRVMPRRHLILGGEASRLDWIASLRALAPTCEIHNHYGPTETTVGALTYPVTPPLPATPSGTLPLGRPLPGYRAYVLDPQGQPVPIGVLGELCIGGRGVARGYLSRPDLTAEKFGPDPFSPDPSERVYRTGDRARFLPDGTLEFRGRVDQQVKIHGYRIELGEIEAALREHPGVRDAVVVARDDDSGAKQLAAYVVPRRTSQPLWRGSTLHVLPDGTPVAHLNTNETEYIYREIFVLQAYLRHGITIRDGDVIVDAGANIGLFTVFAGRLARDVRILAFEPNPAAFACLQANAEAWSTGARCLPVGLSRGSGSAELTFFEGFSLLSGFHADAATEREVVKAYALNQAAELGDGAQVASKVDELLEGRFRARTVTAELRSLSAVLAEQGVEQIDLLKVNVEKSELEVLQGIDATDWPKIRQLVVEVDQRVNVEPITALLARHGFDVLVEQDPLLHKTELCYVYAVRPTATGPGLIRDHAPDAHVRALPPADGAVLTPVTLRSDLRERLPAYMVPTAFVLLDRLPLTPNGKLDRAALPSPDADASASRQGMVAPRTPTEEMVARVFRDVLKRADFGVLDNFFDLGGHSLMAVRIMAQLRAASGHDLPLRVLFERQTVAGLAEAIDALAWTASRPPRTVAAGVREEIEL